MKKLTIFMGILWLGILLNSSVVTAVPLTENEYTVNVITTQLDYDSWVFTYEITNINQQSPGSDHTGLDGFSIDLPSSAVISNVIVPDSYHGSPGQWVSGIGIDNDSIWYWGNDPASIYPIGSTATFSFQADNVTVGSQWSQLTTYWAGYEPSEYETWLYYGANYTTFDTTLPGPAAIPEPATMLLLSAGLIGFAEARWKFRKR